MQSLVACRVASLAFLKPDFEIQAFFDALVFFEDQKCQSKSQNLAFPFLFFFSLRGLALAKHVSAAYSLQISSDGRSMAMQGARNIAKILLLP